MPLLILLVAFPALWPQERRKPALIRDTDIAEGKDPDEEKKFNPLEARRSVKVAEFYYKRKNYEAAIERYREALEYQPNYIKAFEGLGKTFEKSGETEKAIALYREFVARYPSSAKAEDFRARIAGLEKH